MIKKTHSEILTWPHKVECIIDTIGQLTTHRTKNAKDFHDFKQRKILSDTGIYLFMWAVGLSTLRYAQIIFKI